MKPPPSPKKQTQSNPVLSAVEWANFKGKKMLLRLTIIGDHFSVVSSFNSFREFWTYLMSWSAYLDV